MHWLDPDDLPHVTAKVERRSGPGIGGSRQRVPPYERCTAPTTAECMGEGRPAAR
jgi:hypothetical protein